LNSHPFGLDSESSASTNSTRPVQCQWRESNSRPFGAAPQAAAAAVTPHWQEKEAARFERARRPFERPPGFGSGAIGHFCHASKSGACPGRTLQALRPALFRTGWLANAPKGSNGRRASRTLMTFRSLRFQRSAIPLGEPSNDAAGWIRTTDVPEDNCSTGSRNKPDSATAANTPGAIRTHNILVLSQTPLRGTTGA
jgi:hypothetical protein